MHKSVGAAGMHPTVLQELASVIVRLLFDMFRRPGHMGRFIRTGKRQHHTTGTYRTEPSYQAGWGLEDKMSKRG